MSNIVSLNGSPKVNDSTSAVIISQIEDILQTKTTVYRAIHFTQQQDTTLVLSDILKADILLIVFPLYVDSLPAPLLKILTMIEQAAISTTESLPKVYAVCNCGFFEATQTRLALTILENFSSRAGLTWGYGLGIGCGGALSAQIEYKSRGPAAPVYAALAALCQSIQDHRVGEQNVFIAPRFPRFLYKLAGNMGWRQMAGKNGVRKSLRARPHID